MAQISEDELNNKIEKIIEYCKVNINYVKEVNCKHLEIDNSTRFTSDIEMYFSKPDIKVNKQNTYQYLETYKKLLTDAYNVSNTSLKLFQEIEATNVFDNTHPKYIVTIDKILTYTSTLHITINESIEKARIIYCNKCSFELSMCSIRNKVKSTLPIELSSSHGTLNRIEDFQLETNHTTLMNNLMNTYEIVQLLFETLSLLTINNSSYH